MLKKSLKFNRVPVKQGLLEPLDQKQVKVNFKQRNGIDVFKTSVES